MAISVNCCICSGQPSIILNQQRCRNNAPGHNAYSGGSKRPSETNRNPEILGTIVNGRLDLWTRRIGVKVVGPLIRLMGLVLEISLIYITGYVCQLIFQLFRVVINGYHFLLLLILSVFGLKFIDNRLKSYRIY